MGEGEEGAGMRNQNPSRRELEAEGEVKRKWRPAGRDLMPWKVEVVVKVRRSMPQRMESGRLRRRMRGVGGVDIIGGAGWNLSNGRAIMKREMLVDKEGSRAVSWASGKGNSLLDFGMLARTFAETRQVCRSPRLSTTSSLSHSAPSDYPPQDT